MATITMKYTAVIAKKKEEKIGRKKHLIAMRQKQQALLEATAYSGLDMVGVCVWKEKYIVVVIER